MVARVREVGGVRDSGRLPSSVHNWVLLDGGDHEHGGLRRHHPSVRRHQTVQRRRNVHHRPALRIRHGLPRSKLFLARIEQQPVTLSHYSKHLYEKGEPAQGRAG